jgi:hypothetical protein
VSAGDARLTAGDLTALDAVLTVLGDWLATAAPTAREELRGCLHRIITWPWPDDMHVAVMFCRLTLGNGAAPGGNR